jgi:hypothetical protein
MTAVVIVVVVVVLAACLITARRMKRKPAAGTSSPEGRRGQVVGGTHVGGGRSVAPRRDSEVTGDENPNEPTVPVHKGNSPMDL